THLHNEAVFLGINDEKLGQRLILVIEGEENTASKSRLDAALKETEKRFSKNHIPKNILYIPNLPRIPNGKINRKELLNLAEQFFHE
ncbi:MAG: AMP-binding protein, partial [Kaistella sp.]